MNSKRVSTELRLLLLVTSAFLILHGRSSGSGSSSGAGAGQPQSHSLVVADTLNNRILMFSSPFEEGESATTVLGQGDFTTSDRATTANGLNDPTTLIADGGCPSFS
jgi:hypothetical protein